MAIVAIPSPGIRSVNGVIGNGQNIELTSSDNSVLITPVPGSKEVDLTVNVASSDSGILSNVTCESVVSIGDYVYMQSGTAKRAIATGLATSDVVGVVYSKTSPTVCDIRISGRTIPIFSGLDDTKTYFLSDTTPGAYTITPPTTAGHVLLQVGQAYNSTQFIINKGQRIIRG